MSHEIVQQLTGGARWLAELFGRSELFVDRKGFATWLAEANLKAAALASPDAMQAAMTAYAARPTGPTMMGDVAVIEMCGPVTYKSSWFSYYFGGASLQDLQQQFALALVDPAVKTIVFRVDSPGGCIDMVQEFSDVLFAARGQKPTIAVADTMIASAAYWSMSQVDTIYASASAQLGAIGVYCEHDDISAMLEKAGIKITLIAHGDHKVESSPYEPLSDAARADMQANVDEIGDWFDTTVARGRGVKKSAVLASFGQGKVFRGKQAIALGLADKPGTFGQVLAKLTKGRSSSASARAEGAAPADVHAEAGSAAPAAKKTATMDPVDGACEDGYELRDGLCYPIDTDEDAPDDEQAKAKTAAGRDAAAIAAALAD